MKKSESALSAKPNVQVIERIFALMEILADREEAMSRSEERRVGKECVP